jgi:hypothetical protein
VKFDSKYAVEGFGLIKSLLLDNNDYVKSYASEVLGEIVKSYSNLAFEGLSLIKSLLIE